jgi:RNA polymerase sigma factor (sigma-70 family)
LKSRYERDRASTGGRAIPPPPRATLLGLRGRDPEALAAFFEHYFDAVYGLADYLLGERADAEDVTQEVFLRVQRAAETLDPDRDPLPWLRSITANLCRDFWRSFGTKLAARSIPIDSGAGTALASGGPSPEAELLSSERELQVRRAIAALPESLREVLILRDYEGLDHGEIAGIIGSSPAAARKRYSRALSRLADLLEETMR